jgi:hypothetical protein
MLYTCSFFFQLVPEFSNLCEGITQENDCMNRSCWKTTRTRNNETIKANWWDQVWWRKLEYPEKTTDLPQVTDKLSVVNPTAIRSRPRRPLWILESVGGEWGTKNEDPKPLSNTRHYYVINIAFEFY